MKKGINNIIEAINAMSKDERDLFLNTATLFVLDTQAIMGYKGDYGPEYIMNQWGEYEAPSKLPAPKHGKSATSKRDRRSWKNTKKDKSRHGYHGGSAKGGYCSYDAWGKREKVQRDQRLDYKHQLKDLEGTDADLEELTHALQEKYNCYLRMIEDLDRWTTFHKVKFEAEGIWSVIWDERDNMMKYLDSMYPHIPYEVVVKTVNIYVDFAERRINYYLNRAYNWYIEGEIMDLNIKCHDINSEQMALLRRYNELEKEKKKMEGEIEVLKQKRKNGYYI